MKVLAVILMTLTLIAAVFFGFCYYGAQIRLERMTVSALPAPEDLDTWQRISDDLRNGTFTGTRFLSSELIMPESFQFVTLTLTMTNPGFFPMEFIEFSVLPDPADVLQLPAARTPSLRARSTGDFSATVLTRLGSDSPRNVTVTYCVLGHRFSVTTSL